MQRTRGWMEVPMMDTQMMNWQTHRQTDRQTGISNETIKTLQLYNCRVQLTVHAESHPGVQFASVRHSPVPHDAAVGGPVITAGWRQRQYRRRDGVPRTTRPRLCFQRVRVALFVPPAHKAHLFTSNTTQNKVLAWIWSKGERNGT